MLWLWRSISISERAKLPGRVVGVPGVVSGRCPCGATLRASAGQKVSYVRRAGLPKHGVPPVTCGCARRAVAGRRRGHGGHYLGQDADAAHDVVRRCLVPHQPEAWGQCAGSPAWVGRHRNDGGQAVAGSVRLLDSQVLTIGQ